MGIKQLIWPDIKTLEAAKIARLPALVFSILSTFLWAVMTITTVLGYKSIYGKLVFLYLAFTGAVAVGLFKMRREAAIAYGIISTVSLIFSWGDTFKLLAALVGVFVSLLAIQGIFSYVRLCRKDELIRSDRTEQNPAQHL